VNEVEQQTQRFVCRECGSVYGFTARQADWLRRRVEAAGGNYSIPKSCPECVTRRFLANHPGHRLGYCAACGLPFGAPVELRLEPVYCRCCLDERRGQRPASTESSIQS